MENFVRKEFEAHQKAISDTIQAIEPAIREFAELCAQTIREGNRIFFFGNGGSAADAQHLAAEFTGKYQKHRKGLPAISLTSDNSAITSIGNDYGFDHVFSRQIEALARPGDLLVGISTSGHSTNVNQAILTGKENQCKTVGLTGRDGGQLTHICDLAIVVPSDITSRIQEVHILIGHIACLRVEMDY